MALVKKEEIQKKKFAFYIPQELWDEYQKTKLKAVEKGYKFDPTPEMIEALKKVIKETLEELEKK